MDNYDVSDPTCSGLTLLWPVGGEDGTNRPKHSEGIEGWLTPVRTGILPAIPPGGAVTPVA
jgi:hypothetical protein